MYRVLSSQTIYENDIYYETQCASNEIQASANLSNFRGERMVNVGFVSAISSGGYGCFSVQTRIKVVQTSYDLGCMGAVYPFI